jgi:hypothetical protein
VPQQKHFQLLAGAMLGRTHLVAGAQEVAQRLILRLGHMDAGEFARAQQPGQLIGIAPVRLDPVARRPRHARGTDDEALVPQPAQKARERKPARPGLVTEAQRRVGMRGLQLLDQALHVLVRAAQHAPAPHLRRVAGREGDGDGIVVDVQADVDHNFHVSAFLSGLCLTTNHCGSAHRHTPGRNPRSREADTLAFFIASHSD